MMRVKIQVSIGVSGLPIYADIQVSVVRSRNESVQKGELAIRFMFNGKRAKRVYRVQCVVKGGNLIFFDNTENII